MLRMERHAEKRCAELLARLGGAIRQDDSTDELLAGDLRGADLAFVRQTTATQVFAAAEGGRYEPFDEGPEGAADELVDLKSEELVSAGAPDLLTVQAEARTERPDAVEDEDTAELLKHAARRRAAEAAAAARPAAPPASEPQYVSFDPTPVPAPEEDGLEELELEPDDDSESGKESFDLVPDDTEPTFVAKRAPVPSSRPPPAPAAQGMRREEVPSFPPLSNTPHTGVPIEATRPSRRPASAIPSTPVASARASISVVPTIRDGDAPPRPRAAAIQINPTGSGGKVLGLEEEEEPIEIGAAEEDEDGGEVDLAEGFSVTLQTSQELELESDEEEEEEDGEEEDEDAVEPLPAAAPAPPSAEEIAAILARARQSATEGRLQHGAELFSDVIDADPDNVDAHVARGRLYLDLGDYSRAMSDFMVAEDIAPNSPEPQVAIGDLYFARKDYRKAIDYFNAALEVSPNHAMAFCRRGISHYYRKNFKDAVDDLLRAEKLDADIPNIQTYVAMARKKAPKK